MPDVVFMIRFVVDHIGGEKGHTYSSPLFSTRASCVFRPGQHHKPIVECALYSVVFSLQRVGGGGKLSENAFPLTRYDDEDVVKLECVCVCGLNDPSRFGYIWLTTQIVLNATS